MSADTFEQDEQENNLDLRQIVAIARRRFLFFLIPTVLAIIISIAAAFLIPPRYESTGTVLVESQQIPVELVQSTVTSDPNQRITIIKQRVMTRNNLLQIIDKYDVFKEDRKRLSVTKLIEEMQKLVGVEVITADNGRGRRSAATIAFKVSFQHESPQIATKVANELVTLFLSENVKTRTARATETTEFLEHEAEKLKQKLLEAETAISEYKRNNSENLPEHLDLRLNKLERTQNELKALERQIVALREERRYLDVELSSVLSDDDGQALEAEEEKSDAEEEIDHLKKVLSESSVKLTEAHPDIKSLKRRIAVLESNLAEDKAASLENSIEKKSLKPKNRKSALLVQKLQIRISTNSESIKSYTKELSILREKIVTIEKLILKTPEVERALITLNRNHIEIFEKYSELQAKQGKAQLAQNLEEEKKAERFILLEPPILPSDPIWPDRFKIIAIGGFLAFASGIGTAVLVELVDKRVRTASELEALLKHPPLASIPYIKTQRDIQKKRYKVGMTLIFPTILAMGALAAIHFLYKPLDVFFYRAWVYLEKTNFLPF